jgi:methyl-accepting chemotaxis protein
VSDKIEEKIEDAAHVLWEGARSIVAIAAFGGWMAIWLLLVLIGWLFSFPTLLMVSSGMVALTLTALGVQRTVRRRKLEKRAERELVARAQLTGLRLDRNMDSVLRGFDLSYRNVREVIEQNDRIEETLAVDAAVDLERVREHLFDLAKGKSRIVRDLKALGRSTRVESVAATADDLKRRAADHQRQAEQIAKDVQQLSERLHELSRLAAGQSRAGEGGELAKVLSDLDRTAAAYREIEEAEDETARRIRALRALRNASS